MKYGIRLHIMQKVTSQFYFNTFCTVVEKYTSV